MDFNPTDLNSPALAVQPSPSTNTINQQAASVDQTPQVSPVTPIAGQIPKPQSSPASTQPQAIPFSRVQEMQKTMDSSTVMKTVYNSDPIFKAKVDSMKPFYQSQSPDWQSRFPELALNKYYGKSQELPKDPITSQLLSTVTVPSDPFNPLTSNTTPQTGIKGLVRAGADLLPVVMGTIGGVAGGVIAAPTVAGIAPGSAIGSGLGTAAGVGSRNVIHEMLGDGATTPTDQLTQMGIGGAVGAISDVGGQLLSKGVSAAANAISPALKDSAEADVQGVLSPTTKTNKAAAAKITDEILNRPLSDTAALTRKGMLEKAASQVEQSGNEIINYPDLKGATNVDSIMQALEAKKGDFMVGGKAVVPEAVNKIQDVQNVISQFGDTIPDSDMQKVGRILSNEVAKGKNAFLISGDEASKVEAQKVASNAIRSTLAEKYPDLAKLNKEFTFWKSLNDVLSSTVDRKVGQSAGLVKNLATAGAAISGADPVSMGVRATVMRGVVSVVQSPAWGLASAKLKNNLADALAKGGSEDVMAIVGKIARAGATYAGTSRPNAK